MATAAFAPYALSLARTEPEDYQRLYPLPYVLPPQTKRCQICKETLPLADFPLWKTSKDGHRYQCFYCIEHQERPKPRRLLRFENERARLWQVQQQLSANKEEERRLLNARVGRCGWDEAFHDLLRGLRRSYQELWKRFLRLRQALLREAGELAALLLSCEHAPARG